MKSTIWVLLVATIVLCFLPTFVFAEGDARDYIAAPEGTKLIVVYHNRQTANRLYADGGKVSDDFNLKANITIFRPVIYAKIGPFLADPQMLIPFGDVTIDGNAVGGTEISASGIADPILTATFWLVNKPEKKWWLGFTPYFFIPIGNYDSDRPINLGENRWTFREEFATVIGLCEGTYLDLYGAVNFYGNNDDYGSDSLTLKQDPAYFAEAHLSYDITDSYYVAAEYFFKYGGEKTIGGVDLDDEARDHATRVTFGFWLKKNFQLLIKYRHDLHVENGPETQSLETRVVFVF